jgi:hypothetical protein
LASTVEHPNSEPKPITASRKSVTIKDHPAIAELARAESGASTVSEVSEYSATETDESEHRWGLVTV